MRGVDEVRLSEAAHGGEHFPRLMKSRSDAEEAGVGREAHFAVKGFQEREANPVYRRGREVGGGDGGQDGRHIAYANGTGHQRERGAFDLNGRPLREAGETRRVLCC